MSVDQDLDELVLLYTADGSKVVSEIRYGEFEAVVAGETKLAEHAASVVKAAYAQVGGGLTLHGIVFFRFTVDEDGEIVGSFNLPLRYLLENAGLGPDLGAGPIHLACRGQCPVPWHSVNLWQPEGEGDGHPAMLAQKAIWRNRAGLKRTAAPPVAQPLRSEPVEPALIDEERHLEDRLTATFGEQGKVNLTQLVQQHSAQLSEVGQQHRLDLEEQQRTFQDQLREARDEIHKLKAALRREQERNRRLQSLLRGDP